MAQTRLSSCLSPLLGLMLLCPPPIASSPGDPAPPDDCFGSYNVSKGTSLHPKSFEDGADLLSIQSVNSSQRCLADCCSVKRCNLALLEERSEGKIICLLIDCFDNQKAVCKLISRQGYEASTRSLPVQKSDDPSAIPAVDCLAPSKTGPCRASIRSWFYDVTSKTCKVFIYGGCLANGNNFKSKEDCLKNCDGVTAPSNNSVPVSGRSIMSLKDCSRQCSADEFKCADGCCISLSLLCDGMAQCFDKSDESYCSAIRASYKLLVEYQEPTTQDNERCNAPKKIGSCRAAFPRWYFDPKAQICNLFIFGGCKGNKNNYESEAECLAACAGQKEVIPEPQTLKADDEAYCFAPAVTSPCRASFLRWRYDAETQSCHSFIYGGCRGTKNNYETEAECLTRCSGKKGSFKHDSDGNFNKQHHPELRHHASAISMVVLLAICVLILLGGVIYFIVKLAKTDHVVSYHRTKSGEDKETLINTVENL
ncbi:kunitz-type protease inhibitor 2 [Heptranchias perlo]|uniref:kunitz-type protease inhibitor 2 n=1 Tax=Heptranchias perlo TaxID=212740 RepID=UPI00355ABB16